MTGKQEFTYTYLRIPDPVEVICPAGINSEACVLI